MSYNGWSNYETWATHLWLANEEPTYKFCRLLACRCRESAPVANEVRSGIWSEQEYVRIRLAQSLRAHVEEQNPISSCASLYADLLNAALSDVDWTEIAEAFLEEDERSQSR